MNFYNPYYYSLPTSYMQPKVGLLGRLFGNTGISIGNFLNGTQRILNIANQTIPLVKQVKPMIGNAKTMFKVMNEFKKVEVPKENILRNNSNTEIDMNSNINSLSNKEEYDLGPTFFI